MSILKEFKAFAMRGNVVDLAVAVVIGTAFGKIVTSMVNDMVMPPLNLITAKTGANFNALSLKFSQLFGSKINLPVLDAAGKPVMEKDGVTASMALSDPDILRYGPFLQATLDFIIVAFAIFMMVKVMNSMKKAEAEAAPAVPSEDVLLLREIRDAMQKNAPRRVD